MREWGLSPGRDRVLSIFHSVQTDPGAYTVYCWGLHRDLFRGVKRLAREADQAQTFDVPLKNMISDTSTVRYVVVEWCLGKADFVPPVSLQIFLWKTIIVFTKSTALFARNST
jgi:hypothetical protein